MKVTIIRTSGNEETIDLDPGSAIAEIHKIIGAETLDTVNLRNGQVMLVDDNGYETQMVNHGGGHIELRPVRARKPANPEATKLYHATCQPGTTHEIVGDVAIVNDADFAEGDTEN